MTIVSGLDRFASRLRRSKRSSSSLSLSNAYDGAFAVLVRMVTLGAGFNAALDDVLEDDVLELEDPSETRRIVGGDVDGR